MRRPRLVLYNYNISMALPVRMLADGCWVALLVLPRRRCSTASVAREETPVKSIFEEFKAFILRGNLVDLAIGIVIGAAFTAVVTALVADLFTPLLAIPGKVDFSTWTWTVNQSVFRPGAFINALISFVIVAVVLFFFVVKPVNTLMARYKPTPAPPAETKECPYCLSSVPVKATRCAFCTSQLDASAEEQPAIGIKSSAAPDSAS